MRHDFIIGIDLGKRRDMAAFAGLRRTPLVIYPANASAPGGPPVEEEDEEEPLLLRAEYCLQVPKRTAYYKVAQHAADLSQLPQLVGRVNFALDITGAEAALEIFEQHRELDGILWPIVTTMGQKPKRDPVQAMRWTVPKTALRDAVLNNLQRRRLECCVLDPWHFDVLRTQMFAFKPKRNEKTGSVAMEAETESVHDDLVSALMLATWLSGIVPLTEADEPGAEQVPYTVLPGLTTNVERPLPTWRGPEDVHAPAGSSGYPLAPRGQT
jgi:hypothetical protein